MKWFVNSRSDKGGMQRGVSDPSIRALYYYSCEDQTIHGLVTGMRWSIDDDIWTGYLLGRASLINLYPWHLILCVI